MGTAGISRHVHPPRPDAWQSLRVLHDRATGDQPRGYWDIIETDPPRSLVFLDGFSNDDGTPNDAVPRNEGRVTIEEIGQGRTRMSIQFQFSSAEAMEQMLAMQMEAGLTEAVGQIDAILAEDVAAKV